MKIRILWLWTVLVAMTSPAHSRPTVTRAWDRSSGLQPYFSEFDIVWPDGVTQAIQYLLRAHGYGVPIDGPGPRGELRPDTKRQLENFQRSLGLNPTGTMDEPTWEALIVPLTPGATGQAVRAVQMLLNRYRHPGVVLNGVFDVRTVRAVKELQKSHGLRPDGVVEPYTWGFLTGVLREWEEIWHMNGVEDTQSKVRAIQYLLQARGYGVRADGFLGPETRRQLSRIQRSHSLDPTGELNDATWDALIVRLRPGARGPAVRAVQILSKMPVNGEYDQRTLRAITALQKGLHPDRADGILDPDTWVWLFGAESAGAIGADSESPR